MKKNHFLSFLFLSLVLSLFIPIKSHADAPVAKIGETEYSSVEEAFSASHDNDTIKLVADATVSSQLPVTGKLITFDLNGYTLTVDSSITVDLFNVFNGILLFLTAVFWVEERLQQAKG